MHTFCITEVNFASYDTGRVHNCQTFYAKFTERRNALLSRKKYSCSHNNSASNSLENEVIDLPANQTDRATDHRLTPETTNGPAAVSPDIVILASTTTTAQTSDQHD